MSNTTKDAIRLLLQEWLEDPNSWKETALALSSISRNSDSGLYLSANAQHGMAYMASVVFMTMCKKCGDERGFAWLSAFAEAYLRGDSELPVFDTRCWTDSCDGQQYK